MSDSSNSQPKMLDLLVDFRTLLYICFRFIINNAISKITMPLPKFTSLNPYKDCPEHIRFVSNVDKTIYNFFYAIYPTNGLQQTTINLLFSKLHAKCIELGITPGSVASDVRFHELITGLRLELPGSTSGSTNELAKAQNDGRATSGSSAASKATKDSSTKLPSTVGKGKRPSRAKKPAATK